MSSTAAQSIRENARATGNSAAAGTQTLMRGLDLIEALADRSKALPELSADLGLAKSTAHRIASALVDRGYLAFTPREGYRLGPKLLELGFLAQDQVDLVQIARPHLEQLSSATEDTVHLGALSDDTRALYLDKVAGSRRITISSRIGDRQPLSSTGLGKALILDRDERFWSERFTAEQGKGGADRATWIERMREYASVGRAFDLEENEDRIRCVAAPVRDASGGIIGAISVSGAAQYMDNARMEALTETVRDTAGAISRDLGWDAG